MRHHLEASTVLQGREIPSVTAVACKVLQGAMEFEGMALGMSELLVR